jgi:uncharacterized tellurite resistance protein B-like protein
MDVADRRKICQLVAGILVSDEAFAAEEKAFLRRIYERFQLGDDAWEEVEPIEAGAAGATLRELPYEVRHRVVALLIEAAVVDGVVDPRERAYLLVAAAALDIDADVMERRLVERLERLPDQGPMSNP